MAPVAKKRLDVWILHVAVQHWSRKKGVKFRTRYVFIARSISSPISSHLQPQPQLLSLFRSPCLSLSNYLLLTPVHSLLLPSLLIIPLLLLNRRILPRRPLRILPPLPIKLLPIPLNMSRHFHDFIIRSWDGLFKQSASPCSPHDFPKLIILVLEIGMMRKNGLGKMRREWGREKDGGRWRETHLSDVFIDW